MALSDFTREKLEARIATSPHAPLRDFIFQAVEAKLKAPLP